MALARPLLTRRGQPLGARLSPPVDPARLHLASDLRLRGVDPRVDHAPDGARWYSVRHGVWMTSTHWHELDPTGRHAAFVAATALRCRAEPGLVFSHTSAAAVWGLPRIESWPSVTHVLQEDSSAGSSQLVRRHAAGGGEPVRWVRLRGLRVTPPADTVVALARTSTLHSALAAADAALRHGLCSPTELALAAGELAPRARGRPRALLVAQLADAGSMSAGESLSRSQMFLHRIPRPELQVAHTDDNGLIGLVDFQWEGVVGEFDGAIKYGLTETGSSREHAQILFSEKQREDRLRRRGLKVARWVYADALTPARMLRLLAEQGVVPAPRGFWLESPDLTRLTPAARSRASVPMGTRLQVPAAGVGPLGLQSSGPP